MIIYKEANKVSCYPSPWEMISIRYVAYFDLEGNLTTATEKVLGIE